MVRIPIQKSSGEMTISWDSENTNDKIIIKTIKTIISEMQPTCFNCCNYGKAGCLGNYQASSCKIYGILESLDNPHYDCDGSKCKDYKRKEEFI